MTIASIESDISYNSDLVVNHLHMLYSVTVDYGGQRYLVVERSPRVKDHQPLYRLVAEYLEQHPHTVIYEEKSRDTSMMGYRKTTRIYQIHN